MNLRLKNKISLQNGLIGLEERQKRRITKRKSVNERFREDHRLNKAAKTIAKKELYG